MGEIIGVKNFFTVRQNKKLEMDELRDSLPVKV